MNLWPLPTQRKRRIESDTTLEKSLSLEQIMGTVVRGLRLLFSRSSYNTAFYIMHVVGFDEP